MINTYDAYYECGFCRYSTFMLHANYQCSICARTLVSVVCASCGTGNDGFYASLIGECGTSIIIPCSNDKCSRRASN